MVDVSRVGPGSAWEIEQLHAHGLLPKCIFIVQQGHEAQLDEALTRLITAGGRRTVFVFNRRGKFLQPKIFANELNARLVEALEARGKQRLAHASAAA